MSHPEVVLLFCIDSPNVFQCSADPISRVSYWLYWVSYLYITRNNRNHDQTNQYPLSIFYVRVIRNTLCGVNHTKKCTSPPHSTEIFSPCLPIHTPQFYVCGSLISRAPLHVQWIKLVRHSKQPPPPFPYIALGRKKFRYISIGVEFFSIGFRYAGYPSWSMTRFTGALTALWAAKYRDVKCRGTNEPEPCSHGRDLNCLPTEGFRPDTCFTLLILKGK